MLFYFYLVYPVSIAILLESYEETAMELGHVSDTQSSLNDGDLFQWITNWQPW